MNAIESRKYLEALDKITELKKTLKICKKVLEHNDLYKKFNNCAYAHLKIKEVLTKGQK